MCIQPDRRRLLGQLLFCMVMVLAATGIAFDAPATEPQTAVLALYGSRPDLPANILVDEIIRSTLEQELGPRLDFYAEFLDTARWPEAETQAAVRDFLRRRYAQRKLSVIIVVAQPAINFIRIYGDELFPGVPIVAYGPLDALRDWEPGRPITGMLGKIDISGTVELMLRLQPRTREILVISGASASDQWLRSIARPQLDQLEKRVKFTYLTGLAVEDLVNTVAKVPDGTAILFLSMLQDSAGNKLLSQEVLARIAKHARVPIYSQGGTYLGLGSVGGVVFNPEALAHETAQRTLRVLRGERLQDLPVQESKSTVPMVDWRQLKLWGLDEKRLPAGTVVRFREASVWESYRGYIVGGISLILAEALLIFGLIWQRARRAKAEGELRESEARFRSLADTAPVLIWMSGTDMLCTYVNQPWLDFTGRSVEEELGNGWMDGVHPDDFQRCLDTYTQSFDRREKLRMEYRVRRYDGEYRWVLDVGVPRFQGSSFAGYIGCALDVTERKSMEKAVGESEERLRLAAQAGRMFAYSWDADTDVIERSGESAEILGIGPEQASSGAAISAMVHPDDKERLDTVLAKLTVDEPNLQITYRIIRPDGTVAWLERNSRAHFNEQGELKRIVGMIVDVTERKLAEEALASLSRRLIQAQEQERVRIARELHDHVNQLISMLAIDLAKLGQHRDSTSELRTSLDELALRLSDISAEVQAISHRLHSSKLEYLGLVAASKSFCKEVAERQNVKIEFRSAGVPSAMPQDISLTLFRVLQEALQNAIKHSGALHFTVHLHGLSGELQLIVQDNGVGFDVERAIGNHGIGLISMRERVSLVKGTISITSQPGAGTEISVRVPMPAGNESHQTASQVA